MPEQTTISQMLASAEKVVSDLEQEGYTQEEAETIIQLAYALAPHIFALAEHERVATEGPRAFPNRYMVKG